MGIEASILTSCWISGVWRSEVNPGPTAASSWLEWIKGHDEVSEACVVVQLKGTF